MVTKKKAAKSTRKASGEARILHSVYQSGTMYNPGKDDGPGDERKLMNAGLSDEVLQNLTDRGHIEGFGFTASKAAKTEEEPEAEE